MNALIPILIALAGILGCDKPQSSKSIEINLTPKAIDKKYGLGLFGLRTRSKNSNPDYLAERRGGWGSSHYVVPFRCKVLEFNSLVSSKDAPYHVQYNIAVSGKAIADLPIVGKRIEEAIEKASSLGNGKEVGELLKAGDTARRLLAFHKANLNAANACGKVIAEREEERKKLDAFLTNLSLAKVRSSHAKPISILHCAPSDIKEVLREVGPNGETLINCNGEYGIKGFRKPDGKVFLQDGRVNIPNLRAYSFRQQFGKVSGGGRASYFVAEWGIRGNRPSYGAGSGYVDIKGRPGFWRPSVYNPPHRLNSLYLKDTMDEHPPKYDFHFWVPSRCHYLDKSKHSTNYWKPEELLERQLKHSANALEDLPEIARNIEAHLKDKGLLQDYRVQLLEAAEKAKRYWDFHKVNFEAASKCKAELAKRQAKTRRAKTKADSLKISSQGQVRGKLKTILKEQ